MTTTTTTTSSPPDPFAEADLTWELERLYQDLAKFKKGQKPLGNTEKRYLRGLLCGYGPEELAKKVRRQPKSLTSYLSRTLYQYIKELTGHEKLQNHSQISDWLEKYKRPRETYFSLKSRPEVTLPIDGTFHIEHGHFYVDGINNLVKGDVHIHFEAPLSEKPKGRKE